MLHSHLVPHLSFRPPPQQLLFPFSPFSEKIRRNTHCIIPANHSLKTWKRTCFVFFCGSDVFFLCTNKCSLPPATPGSPYTPLSEHFTDAFTGNYGPDCCRMWRQTEPDNESSSKVTRGERHASDAAWIQSAFTLCFCVRSCPRTRYRPRGSRADGALKAILVVRHPPVLEASLPETQTVQTGQKITKNKKELQMFLDPLCRCVVYRHT